ETKFFDKVFSIDSTIKAEVATVNSNIVHGSMATEILLVKNRPKQVQCLPFLPSSNFGLKILMGKDEMIDFKDFLGKNFLLKLKKTS
ncbi:4546_t:CDS:2, partial [Dentiscutata erythropus]